MAERGDRRSRNIDRWVGIPLVSIASRLRPRRSPAAIPPQGEPAKLGVLCIGAIGDLILVSAILSDLRARWPGCEMVLYASPTNAPLLPLVKTPDRVDVVSLENVSSAVAKVRSERFDLLIDTAQWARISALLALASGARMTVGFNSPDQHRHRGFDVVVPHMNDRHEIENFRALIRPLGVPSRHAPELTIPESAQLEAAGLGLGDYVVFHAWPAGIRRELKEWPAERWVELIRHARDRGFRVVLTGGVGDRPRVERLLERLPRVTEVVNLAGAVRLPTVAAVLRAARAVISVNTGIMHLAAVIGAPVAGLHGPTNPARWGPLGARALTVVPDAVAYGYLNLGFEYPDNPPDSMGGISLDEVRTALDSLIDGEESSGHGADRAAAASGRSECHGAD